MIVRTVSTRVANAQAIAHLCKACAALALPKHTVSSTIPFVRSYQTQRRFCGCIRQFFEVAAIKPLEGCSPPCAGASKALLCASPLPLKMLNEERRCHAA